MSDTKDDYAARLDLAYIIAGAAGLASGIPQEVMDEVFAEMFGKDKEVAP